MDSLKERAVRGGLAKMAGQALSFMVRFVFIIVLARLLDPSDFGLVAMVTVVTGVYELFATAGLASATVQRVHVTEAQISTLFWINIVLGVVLAGLCLTTAPLIAHFYGEPRLFWVTIVLSSGFIFSAAGVQHFAILQREIRYVAITLIEALALVVSTGVGIAMALLDYGYWALVASSIALPAINTGGLWLVTRWVPGLPQRDVELRSMLLFGGTITLNNLVTYIAYNIEKALLGRYWGAEALGIYGRATYLIQMPTTQLSGAVGGVVFSVLARLQTEPQRLKAYFLKAYTLVLSVTAFVTIFFATFAEDVILVILGEKWGEAVTVFRLLTPTVLIFGIINPMAWLLPAIGLQGRSLLLALAIAPIVTTSYFIGLPYGPNGVALAFSVAMTIWLIPHIMWCLHGTNVSPSDVLFVAAKPLLASLVAAAVAFSVHRYASLYLPALPRLLLAGGVMSVIYACILLFVFGHKAIIADLIKSSRQPGLDRRG